MDNKNLNLIIGIVLLICGGWILLNPVDTLQAMYTIVGSIFIVRSSFGVFNYFKGNKKKQTIYEIILEFIKIIFGILLIVKFIPVTKIVVYIIAVFLVFEALFTLYISLFVKKLDKEVSRSLIIDGVVTLIFAVFLFTNSVATVSAIIISFGVLICLLGIANLIYYFKKLKMSA
ncbi:MAG: HdeD family acid-resistance protein [Bacilli bacterium]